MRSSVRGSKLMVEPGVFELGLNGGNVDLGCVTGRDGVGLGV